MDCEKFEVRLNNVSFRYCISNGDSKYVHNDLTVHPTMGFGGTLENYYITRKEAEEKLRRFKEKMCAKSEVAKTGVTFRSGVGQATNSAPAETPKSPFIPRKATNAFIIDHDKGEVEQLFSVRLRNENEDNDFENALESVTLEVATPHSGETFIPLARLEFKGGRVVMYRERGAFDPYIETDSEGRIQN